MKYKDRFRMPSQCSGPGIEGSEKRVSTRERKEGEDSSQEVNGYVKCSDRGLLSIYDRNSDSSLSSTAHHVKMRAGYALDFIF